MFSWFEVLMLSFCAFLWGYVVAAAKREETLMDLTMRKEQYAKDIKQIADADFALAVARAKLHAEIRKEKH